MSTGAAPTLAQALAQARQIIPLREARLLLQQVLQCSHADIAAHPQRLLGAGQAEDFRNLVTRRGRGVPVAYLTGRCEFYGRSFAITPAALIPRPETELLVDAALAQIEYRARPNILDLGSGSGVLAVTLALERPGARVTGLDCSPQALALARANATSLNAPVRFLESDWFAAVAAERFDLIVANPPYVAAADPHLLQGDLRFEPAAALTDGSADGLASLRTIISAAPLHLAPGGALAVEHGYDQGQQVRALFQAAGFTGVRALSDLAGLPRVVAGVMVRHGAEGPRSKG